MEELDEDSQRFAQVLFAAFPEWRQFVLAGAAELFSGNVAGKLIVKVPSPIKVESPEFGNWLLIDTCDGEVTITYDYFHSHFDCFSDVAEHEGFKDAIEFLQAFISEELSVVVLMNGDVCRGSTTVKPGEEVSFRYFVRPFDGLYIRSWKGSYDRKQAIPN